MDYIMNFIEQIFDLVNEMSPYLLLGFLIAGLMHAFIPNSLYNKYLSGNTFRSVLNAAIFGVPLPLCSCGVIPTAMSLRREGASKGATVSFLIATPQTGVDSIFATYSLMGLPFAIVRPIAALVTAVLGGQFVNSWAEEDELVEINNGNTEKSVHETHNHEEHSCCGHDHCDSECSEHKHSFVEKLKDALKFGFVEMMEDIGKWLVIGLLIAGVITVIVPDSFFAVFKDNTLMSMLLVLCISIPMYLCATGSIPIAVALMMKGLTPGAALVLLMAGPASNAASILVINKVLGKRTLVLYLIAIVTGAVAFGFGIDYLLPSGWFTSSIMMSDACCHEDSNWFNILCSLVLCLLLLNVVWMRLNHKSACSCGHCHDGEEKQNHEHGCQCHCCENEEEHCETRTYIVGGMTCNHCKANVEKVIMTVKGVEAVKVDLHTGEVQVTGDDLDDNEIISAVESIGFAIKLSK